MPRKDAFHDAFTHALTTEGWTITRDPFNLRRGRQTLTIDIGVEMQFVILRQPVVTLEPTERAFYPRRRGTI